MEENHIKRVDYTFGVDLQEHFATVSKHFSAEMVIAGFHPYAELKHTWSRNADHLEFRISDYLRGSPDAVLESLAWYLLSRAYGRRCASERWRTYLVHAFSPQLWTPVRDLYLLRQKNLLCDPRGEARNLHEVFRYVNSRYFSGRARDPILAWSRESPRTRLGFYFAPLGLLAANKVMDAERVPRYVLEFVMYHELLHDMDRGNSVVGPKRVHHTKDFRGLEKAFAHYDDAELWLHRVVRVSRKK